MRRPASASAGSQSRSGRSRACEPRSGRLRRRRAQPDSWQRLAMVAGRRWLGLAIRISSVSAVGSSSVFRNAFAPLAFSASAVLDDADLEAAPIARQRQRLDELADLIDLDLLRILQRGAPRANRDECRRAAARSRRRRPHGRAPGLAQRQRGDPMRQLLRTETRARLRISSACGSRRGLARRTQALLRLLQPRQGVGAQEIHCRAPEHAENLRGHLIDASASASMTTMRSGSARGAREIRQPHPLEKFRPLTLEAIRRALAPRRIARARARPSPPPPAARATR